MYKILSAVKAVPAVSGIAVLAVSFSAFAEAGTSSEPIGIGKGRASQRKEASIDAGNIQKQVYVKPEAAAAENKAKVERDKAASLVNGKPVLSVRVEGITGVDPNLVARVIKTRIGEKLSVDTVREDTMAIFNLGYFREVVPDLQVMKDQKGKKEFIQVTYKVVEHPVIKDISIEGTTLVSKYGLVRMLGISNTTPNMAEITKKIGLLNDELRKNGFVAASVTGLNLTPDGVLHVSVNEGKIEGFKVTGNKRTKEHVILREMQQKPGEAFNSILAQRSVQRLYNLGIFDDVNIRLNPGQVPGNVEVVVEIEEANTAVIGLGSGYSESDGFTGQVSFTEKNLFGTGDSVSAKWEFGGKDNANYDVSYTKNWLDKKGTSMSINVYRGTHEYSDYDRDGNTIADYDRRRVGEEITFSRPEGSFVRNYITLKHRKDSYRGADGGGPQYYEDGYAGQTYGKTTEERRRENFGETRSIIFSRVYDSRDNYLDPHHGKRNSYTFEVGGFGGDFNFQKFSVDYRYYWELNRKTKHVLALNLAAGIAHGNMPLSQRFAVGGSTLRGYKDDQFRGNSMLRASLEYRVPIAKRISAVAFIDNGYAWDKRDERRFDLSKLKTGYGVGLRFQSPIGPIRLDYGISKERKRFHFSFGGSF